MKPVVGAIHELPLRQVLAIDTIAYHTCIQQCRFFNHLEEALTVFDRQ